MPTHQTFKYFFTATNQLDGIEWVSGTTEMPGINVHACRLFCMANYSSGPEMYRQWFFLYSSIHPCVCEYLLNFAPRLKEKRFFFPPCSIYPFEILNQHIGSRVSYLEGTWAAKSSRKSNSIWILNGTKETSFMLIAHWVVDCFFELLHSGATDES